MMLKPWDQLPDYMRTDAVRPYYDVLKKRQGSLVLKRIFDFLVALILLLIIWPILIIIAIAVRLDTPGPAFFRQVRVTTYGRKFRMWKYRTMVANADKMGPQVTTNNDMRVTRIGKILRGVRLDELPQLINILKGDMSVVGPRPERIEHVKQYTEEIPEFAYRLTVKGGLTGFAQVYGKYNTTAYDKLKLDLMYIQNYSILLDLEIIIRTIQVLFTKESTEGFDESKSKEMTEHSRHDLEE